MVMVTTQTFFFSVLLEDAEIKSELKLLGTEKSFL